jgi:hypothetical protein
MSKINNNKKEKKEQQRAISLDIDKITYDNDTTIRSVSKIIKSQTTQDGEGVTLNRSFPNNYISEFDPFLLLDELGPMDVRPGKQRIS